MFTELYNQMDVLHSFSEFFLHKKNLCFPNTQKSIAKGFKCTKFTNFVQLYEFFEYFIYWVPLWMKSMCQNAFSRLLCTENILKLKQYFFSIDKKVIS